MPSSAAETLPTVNRRFHLAARPSGMPKESDFRIEEGPAPRATEGQILVRSLYWSVDPYMRGRITGVKTYADPVLVGDLMAGGAVGEVIESKSPAYSMGDYVTGYWGWQDYAAVNPREVTR